MSTSTTKVSRIDQILAALPQRYPFLFVDNVIELDPGVCIHTQKAVSYNEWYFQGHFPGKPVLPGNIIVEIMAQTTGLLLLNNEAIKTYPLRPGYLAQCNVKFLHRVLPGMILDIKARTTILSDNCLQANVSVYAELIKIATGDITIAFEN